VASHQKHSLVRSDKQKISNILPLWIFLINTAHSLKKLPTLGNDMLKRAKKTIFAFAEVFYPKLLEAIFWKANCTRCCQSGEWLL